ncbi:MAG: hypothetical protein, partial [Olavius algarvensis Gamma 1 endosymbiont]
VQASKLIESFLVGLPVPAVFLYTERKSQKFFVIRVVPLDNFMIYKYIIRLDRPD